MRLAAQLFGNGLTLPSSVWPASDLEVEQMLTELIRQLEKAGVLEDTVFAMCCDHCPYALSDSELAELYGLPEKGIRGNFDLYRNGFLLWSPSMDKPVTVDTPCSSIDILPTLCNLFGLSYNSRLITGTDILSPTENLSFSTPRTRDTGTGSPPTEPTTMPPGPLRPPMPVPSRERSWTLMSRTTSSASMPCGIPPSRSSTPIITDTSLTKISNPLQRLTRSRRM